MFQQNGRKVKARTAQNTHKQKNKNKTKNNNKTSQKNSYLSSLRIFRLIK